MASAIIHIAVAKVLKPYLNIKNEKDYYLGSIAPDIAKQIGQTKHKTHFLYNTKGEIPNIEMFTNKYKNYKDNDFDLGYFIHLYTDKIWFKEFISSLVSNNIVKLLDGTIINADETEIHKLIYNDYTNLNIQIIDEYELNLNLFYEEFNTPNSKIEELPVDKLNILIDQMGIIIENSKSEKKYIFDIQLIKQFIEHTKKKILEELNIKKK